MQLLREQRVATMGDLKEALGTEVDLTVFRKLKQLGSHTSYSHRGRYYTLEEIARFDALGLWSFRSVHFSRYGTLLRTAQALVETSDAGAFVGELDHVLEVGVKDPLRKLVQDGLLSREKIAGRYLYCSAERATRKEQLASRRVLQGSPSLTGPPGGGVFPDELRAAIILFYSLLDEKQRRLYAGLESFKWGHGGDRGMAELLGLDVGTVARGRRQLLQEDVEVGRVRKPGGGRKPVKKKLQR